MIILRNDFYISIKSFVGIHYKHHIEALSNLWFKTKSPNDNNNCSASVYLIMLIGSASLCVYSQYKIHTSLVQVLFVLRFYGPVDPVGSCQFTWVMSVYLTTRFLIEGVLMDTETSVMATFDYWAGLVL